MPAQSGHTKMFCVEKIDLICLHLEVDMLYVDLICPRAAYLTLLQQGSTQF